MTNAPVLIIGAGMGGLSAAALLAAQGMPVVVLERQPTPGGKLRQVEVAGAAIDAGPTVFTMRWVFERLFAEAGGSFASEVRLAPTELLARHAWDDRGIFDLFADPAATEQSIGEFFGAAEVRGYRAFSAEAKAIYDVLLGSFLEGSRPTPITLMTRIGLRRLPEALAIKPHQSLWRALTRHFADARLRQLFGRYATYCGASPFAAPATLMLIAHVEQQGVWLAKDGMHAIAKAIEALALRQGAAFRYGAAVDAVLVEGGRAVGVRLAGGEEIRGSAVLCNADPAALAVGKFGDAARRATPGAQRMQRSLSSMTWMVNAPTGGFPLVRHNVFFSDDYRAEFDAIFARGQLPARPTVYVCAQDRDDRGGRVGASSEQGAERLQLIVNAPANGDGPGPSAAEIAACEAATFDLLHRCGLDIASTPDTALLMTPAGYEALFPATGGALYGLAAHGWRTPFQRPGAASKLPGLYLAGGGVHPGAGLPMASLSGRLAAMRILSDRARR